MKETIVIKFILILSMLGLSVLSFSQINTDNPIYFNILMFISGLFFIHESIWIFRIKTK